MDQPVDPIAQQGRAAVPGRLLFLLIAMTAIGPMSFNILVPAVPGLARKLATDAASVQLTISLFLVGLAGAQLLLGPLSDRFGRRPVVLGGLALTVLSSLAAMAASSIETLILARLVQALGASAAIVIGRAIVRDLVERERAASTLGLVTSAVVLAPMLAPLVGGILDTVFGWEAIFVFVAATSAAVLAWAVAVLPETRPPALHGRAGSQLATDLRAFAHSPKFSAYALAAALSSAPFYTFVGGAPHVVVNLMGRSSAEYGAWFILNSIGFMAGNFATSRLATRYGIDRLIKYGLAIQLAGSLASAILGHLFFELGPILIFLPQCVMSLGNGIVLPNAIAGAVSIRPQAAGTASGIAGFLQMGIGAALTQFVVLALEGATTSLPMTLTMVAVSVVAFAGFLMLMRGSDAGEAVARP